jgi:FAD:protein FMN transferase
MQPWLGTFVEVGAADDTGISLNAALATIAEVHGLLSFHEPGSDLSRLNRGAGRLVRLHPLSVRALRLARALMRASRERFNCTVGGALERLGMLPVHDAPALLEHGGAEDIMILDRTSARLRRPVHVTLDGLAKGLAVDLAVHTMRANGARAGWVNAGGDLRVFGPVSLPLKLRDDTGYRTAGYVTNRAVATSVVSAAPDQRFAARIVSTTGDRIERGSWSVLARHAWRADALTKVAALLPAAQRDATLRELGGRLIDSRPGAP